MKMKKILVHCNQSQLENKLKELKEGVEKIQPLLDEFKSLDLFKINDLSDLKNLIDYKEKYVRERLAQEIEVPKFGSLKMKPEAFIATLELPSFNKLNSLADACTPFMYKLSYYELNDNTISIPNHAIEELQNAYSVFATTAKQLRFHEAHKKAAIALQELDSAYKDVFGIEIDRDAKFSSYFLMNNSIGVNPKVYIHKDWEENQ